MTYIVIFNGQAYYEEKIKAKNWEEFLHILSRLASQYGQPPDLIYLKDGR